MIDSGSKGETVARSRLPIVRRVLVLGWVGVVALTALNAVNLSRSNPILELKLAAVEAGWVEEGAVLTAATYESTLGSLSAEAVFVSGSTPSEALTIQGVRPTPFHGWKLRSIRRSRRSGGASDG